MRADAAGKTRPARHQNESGKIEVPVENLKVEEEGTTHHRQQSRKEPRTPPSCPISSFSHLDPSSTPVPLTQSVHSGHQVTDICAFTSSTMPAHPPASDATKRETGNGKKRPSKIVCERIRAQQQQEESLRALEQEAERLERSAARKMQKAKILLQEARLLELEAREMEIEALQLEQGLLERELREVQKLQLNQGEEASPGFKAADTKEVGGESEDFDGRLDDTHTNDSKDDMSLAGLGCDDGDAEVKMKMEGSNEYCNNTRMSA